VPIAYEPAKPSLHSMIIQKFSIRVKSEENPKSNEILNEIQEKFEDDENFGEDEENFDNFDLDEI
jgi:hypothetical protein